MCGLPLRRKFGKTANVMDEGRHGGGQDTAVKLAALRILLATVVESAAERELTPVEEQVARLLLSGRGVSDICNALGMSAAAAYVILIDLAR